MTLKIEPRSGHHVNCGAREANGECPLGQGVDDVSHWLVNGLDDEEGDAKTNCTNDCGDNVSDDELDDGDADEGCGNGVSINRLANVHDGFDDTPEDENVASAKDASETKEKSEEETEDFHDILVVCVFKNDSNKDNQR